jgi:cytochrome c553
MLSVRTELLGVLLLCLAGCDYETDKGPTAAGDEIFQQCQQCHGQAAEGNPLHHAPAIAGMPQWYLESQLKKFKAGLRGTHPGDITGMQMRPIGLSLYNDGDIKTIAAHVSALPRVTPPEAMTGGDANRGKQLYATCAACHGVDGAGNELVKAPPLKQANDWYLLSQIKKFKDGQRGLAGDVEGAQMRPQVAILTDEQAMKDVVQYIATFK